jgi:hypothetical protein
MEMTRGEGFFTSPLIISSSKSEARGEASRRDQFETSTNSQIANLSEEKRLEFPNLNLEFIKNVPEYHPACWVDEWHSLSPGGRGLG